MNINLCFYPDNFQIAGLQYLGFWVMVQNCPPERWYTVLFFKMVQNIVQMYESVCPETLAKIKYYVCISDRFNSETVILSVLSSKITWWEPGLY